jgi:hypothetical protein
MQFINAAYPYIVYYADVALSSVAVSATTSSFRYAGTDTTSGATIANTNILVGAVPANQDPAGSYQVHVYNGSTEVFSNSPTYPWFFDGTTGYLTFYVAVDFAPTISFWRYEGTYGTTTTEFANPLNYCMVSDYRNTAGYGVYIQSATISGRGNTLDFYATDKNNGTPVTRSVVSVDPTGYVGIGTTAPAYPLDVNGAVNVGGTLLIGGNIVTDGYLVNTTTTATNVVGFPYNGNTYAYYSATGTPLVGDYVRTTTTNNMPTGYVSGFITRAVDPTKKTISFNTAIMTNDTLLSTTLDGYAPSTTRIYGYDFSANNISVGQGIVGTATATVNNPFVTAYTASNSSYYVASTNLTTSTNTAITGYIKNGNSIVTNGTFTADYYVEGTGTSPPTRVTGQSGKIATIESKNTITNTAATNTIVGTIVDANTISYTNTTEPWATGDFLGGNTSISDGSIIGSTDTTNNLITVTGTLTPTPVAYTYSGYVSDTNIVQLYDASSSSALVGDYVTGTGITPKTNNSVAFKTTTKLVMSNTTAFTNAAVAQTITGYVSNNKLYTTNNTATTSNFLTASTTPFGVSTANLLFYYPLDGDVYDYSTGYPRDNLAYFGWAWSPTTKLTLSSANVRGISNEYIKVPSINFGTNGVTVACWMKMNVSVPYNWIRVMDFGTVSNSKIGLAYVDYGRLMVLGFPGNDTGYILSDLNWHHYCVTVDPSNGSVPWRVYIDGKLVSTANGTHPSSSDINMFGHSNFVADGYTNANYNNCVVYTRTLSASEVATMAANVNSPRRILPISYTGIKYYYSFDRDVYNYASSTGTSPYTIDLSYNNGNISTVTTKLLAGSLSLVAASSQYAQLPPFTYTTAGITVSCWMKLKTIPATGTYPCIFEFASSSVTYGIMLYFSGPQLQLNTETVSSSISYTPDTNWHHYCLTIDPSNGSIPWKVYVDGALTYTTTALYPSKPFSLNYIGKRYNAAVYLDSYVNQFVIYNRTLSATEVATLVYDKHVVANSVPVPTKIMGNTVSANGLALDISSINPIASSNTTTFTGVPVSSNKIAYLDLSASVPGYFVTKSAPYDVSAGTAVTATDPANQLLTVSTATLTPQASTVDVSGYIANFGINNSKVMLRDYSNAAVAINGYVSNSSSMNGKNWITDVSNTASNVVQGLTVKSAMQPAAAAGINYGYVANTGGQMLVIGGAAEGTPGKNTLLYSTNNGVSWTGLGATVLTSFCFGLIYAGSPINRWIAVGSGTNSIAYSSDGTTWTGIGTTIFTTGRGLAWNGTKIIAVGQGNYSIASSTDGITWVGITTTVFDPVASGGLCVTWDGSKFIAGSQATTNTLAYSTDGTTWTGLGKTIFSTLVYGIVYNGTKYVAAGQGTNSLAWSTNGTTWTGLGTTIFSVATCVATRPNVNMFIAGGLSTNYIATSTDGSTWTGLGTTNAGGMSPYSIYWSIDRWIITNNTASATCQVAWSTDPNGVKWNVQRESVFYFTVNGGRAIYSNGVTTNTPTLITNEPIATNEFVCGPNMGNMIVSGGGNDGTNTLAYSLDDGVTWTGLGTTIFANYGLCVAYNGVRWVAVGGQTPNTIAYSNDGITWIGLGTTIFTTYGYGIEWNGTIFVAVGVGTNSIAWSRDGINWTGRGMVDLSVGGVSVAWAQSLGRWVAVGWGGKQIVYSSNGIDWTSAGTVIGDTTNVVYGVAWNGSRFVAVGYPGATVARNSVAYSNDGITWTGLGLTIFSTAGHNVTWNGRMWIACGYGTNTIAVSNDGVIWTGVNNTTTGVFSGNAYSVLWTGSKHIAFGNGAGNTIAYSYDGINWTGQGTTIYINQGRKAACSNMSSNYIVGQSGTAIANSYSSLILCTTGNANTNANAMYSIDDGLTWTNSLIGLFTTAINGIEYNGQIYVACGQGTNTLAYSTDGINWIGLGLGIFSTAAYAVRWNGSMFVAVGQGTNTHAYSYDGRIWTGSAILTIAYAVEWGNNVWVTGGNGATNRVAWSTNGTSWTQVAFTTDIYGMTWNGSVFLAPGVGGISYSADGKTWTASATTGFLNPAYAAEYNGTVWLACGTPGTTGSVMITSTVGTGSWSNVSHGTGFTVVKKILWTGTRWIAFGTGGSYNVAYTTDATAATGWTGITLTNYATPAYTLYGRPLIVKNVNGRLNNLIGGSFSTSKMLVSAGYLPNTLTYSLDDGVTWTGMGSTIFSSMCWGVAYNGAGVWVAGGSGTNSLAYSTDGTSWTGLGSTIFTTGRYAAWSSSLSRWVVVGAGTNTMAYSSDAITWTGVTSFSFNGSNGGLGVTWSSQLGLFVAVGEGTIQIAYSSDGISWTGVGTTIFSTYGHNVAWNGTKFVAVGFGTVNTMAYSTDGTTWTGLGTSTFNSAAFGVAWNGSYWLAGGQTGNTIATSTDGTTWYGVNTTSGVFDTNCINFLWTGTRWIAYGTTANAGGNTMAYSFDGRIWTGLGATIISSNARGGAVITTTPASTSLYNTIGKTSTAVTYTPASASFVGFIYDLSTICYTSGGSNGVGSYFAGIGIAPGCEQVVPTDVTNQTIRVNGGLTLPTPTYASQVGYYASSTSIVFRDMNAGSGLTAGQYVTPFSPNIPCISSVATYTATMTGKTTAYTTTTFTANITVSTLTGGYYESTLTVTSGTATVNSFITGTGITAPAWINSGTGPYIVRSRTAITAGTAVVFTQYPQQTFNIYNPITVTVYGPNAYSRYQPSNISIRTPITFTQIQPNTYNEVVASTYSFYNAANYLSYTPVTFTQFANQVIKFYNTQTINLFADNAIAIPHILDNTDTFVVCNATQTLTNKTIVNLNVTGTLVATGQITAASYAASSDYRMKSNVQPLDADRTIDRLRPVEYDLSGAVHDMGFIAHEVQEEFPFLVVGEKDGEEIQRLNYNGFIALLVKEVQALKRALRKYHTIN